MATIVCYKTHRWGEWQTARLLKLAREAKEMLVVLYNGSEQDLPQVVRETADDLLCYTADDLLWLCKDRNYPSHWVEEHARQGNPQWTDAAASLLPLCLYRSKRKDTDCRYWHIEDDAYLRGDWGKFLDAFKNHREDLIATHICKDTARMSWVKDTLKGYGLPEMPLRTAFMPLCRVSGRLLDELLKAYAQGAEGHFEALVPTLCAHLFGERSVEDMGDQFYTKTDQHHANVGSFGWLPKTQGEECAFLYGHIYHPVKWLCQDEKEILTKTDTSKTVKVSIVITAWNVAEYIEEAVRSALTQTHPDKEVIVVEDCPTDGTDDILGKLETENPDTLRIIRNPKNVGAGMSRRIGILNATGEYTLLLDGDDWLKPTFVETLVRNADGADIVSGGITVLREGGGYEITSYGDKVTEGLGRIKGHFGERIIFMNNKLIRRSLYDTVPYCHRRYIEDTPTIVPLLYLANKVRYVDETGYMYRMRKGSLTHESNALKNALFRALCVKDLIQWFSDKPREYRDLFRRSQYLQLAAIIDKQPKELKEKAPQLWPREWREFAQYLAELLELRDSLLK